LAEGRTAALALGQRSTRLSLIGVDQPAYQVPCFAAVHESGFQSGHSRDVCLFVGPSHQDADTPHVLALLRACRERPRSRRATEQRDELAPLHCQGWTVIILIPPVTLDSKNNWPCSCPGNRINPKRSQGFSPQPVGSIGRCPGIFDTVKTGKGIGRQGRQKASPQGADPRAASRGASAARSHRQWRRRAQHTAGEAVVRRVSLRGRGGGRGTDDTQNWYHAIWNPVPLLLAVACRSRRAAP
jgi:hypothetical protein